MTERTEQLSQALAEHVGRSQVPLLVLRLADRTVVDVSPGFATFYGQEREQLLGCSTEKFLAGETVAPLQLHLIASGAIDSYTRSADLRLPGGGRQVPVRVHVTSVEDEQPRELALATVVADGGPELGPLQSPPAEIIVLGSIDDSWRVDRITGDAQRLLGRPASELIGIPVLSLVHPDDVGALVILGATAEVRGSAAGRVRLKNQGDGWLLCHVSLAPMIGPDAQAYGFCVSRPPDPGAVGDGQRARALENHLHRIAREIAASGVASWSVAVPTSVDLPELSRLSSREYEIVVRLASGARVSAIARRLFLSESTVRNHLTSVYRKLDVGSQQELLDKLAASR